MILSRRSFVAGVSVAAGSAVLGSSLVASAQNLPAGYRWEIHKGVGIKFAVPNAWTISSSGDTLTGKHPAFATNGLFVEFVAAKGVGADKAEGAIMRQLKASLPNAKSNGPVKPATQNGLSGGVLVGTGTNAGGQNKDWISIVMGDGKGHDMLTLVLGNQGLVLSSPDVKVMLDSIRLA